MEVLQDNKYANYKVALIIPLMKDLRINDYQYILYITVIHYYGV